MRIPTVLLVTALAIPSAAAKHVSFSQDIQPILQNSCWKCHGAAFQLSKLDPAASTYGDDPYFMSMDLTWSHANGSVVVAKIDPRLPKYCDLLHVDEPTSSHMQINTEVRPNQVGPGMWPTIKPAGTYRLRVAVTADNAKPLYKTLKIVFDGTWYESEAEMFSRGVVITVES